MLGERQSNEPMYKEILFGQGDQEITSKNGKMLYTFELLSTNSSLCLIMTGIHNKQQSAYCDSFELCVQSVTTKATFFLLR